MLTNGYNRKASRGRTSHNVLIDTLGIVIPPQSKLASEVSEIDLSTKSESRVTSKISEESITVIARSITLNDARLKSVDVVS